MNDLQVFTDIGELLTLAGAEAKQARRPVEADLSLIKDAVLVSHLGRVVWAGSRHDFKTAMLATWGDEKAAGFHSLSGASVLPAFVEPHTHLVFAGDRAHEFEWRMQGQSYQEIASKGGGILFTVRQTREASVAALLALAQARANQFLRQGVTTLEVKTGYGLDTESELRCLGVIRALSGPRVVATYLGAHSRSPSFPDLDSYLKNMCDETLPRIAREKLAERVDIYIEKGFFNLEQARIYLGRARELGLGITAHVEQLSEMGGTSSVLAFAPQSVDHVVYLTDAARTQLAHSSTTAVLLPTSDFYLRMQYPRARQMLDEGVRVALSTDFNPGTSPTQDLSFVGVLARLEMRMTLPEVLTAYTLGAAWAVGRAAESGSLTNGKHCDFIVLHGSWQELFYSVGHHPIKEVYKSGVRIV